MYNIRRTGATAPTPRVSRCVPTRAAVERLLIASTVRELSQLAGPFSVLTSAWGHRDLILRLARRDIEARYRGSLLGVTWSLLVPLAMLTVYTFVFSVVFNARWNVATQGRAQFALVLYAGLILFNFLAECINRAPSLMLENAIYIKRIVFPLEILPWVVVVVAAFNAMIGMLALLLGYVVLLGIPPLTSLLFPLMLAPLVLLALGSTWFLSSLGVFLRDIQQFIPVLMTIVMFGSPILYPPDALPPSFAPFVRLNPIAVTVEQGRRMLFGGGPANWRLLVPHVLGGWLVAWLGLMWFRRTRKAFADVV